MPVALVPLAAASLLVVFGHVSSRWLAAGDAGVALSVLVVSFVLRWTVAFAGSVGIIAVIYHLGTDLTKHMREHLEPLLREPWRCCEGLELAGELAGGGAGDGVVAGVDAAVWVLRDAVCGLLRVYGSLGAAIALMFWLYIIALSVLLGAEFNAQRAARAADPVAFGVFEEAAEEVAGTASTSVQVELLTDGRVNVLRSG